MIERAFAWVLVPEGARPSAWIEDLDRYGDREVVLHTPFGVASEFTLRQYSQQFDVTTFDDPLPVYVSGLRRMDVTFEILGGATPEQVMCGPFDVWCMLGGRRCDLTLVPDGVLVSRPVDGLHVMEVTARVVGAPRLEGVKIAPPDPVLADAKRSIRLGGVK